MTSWMKERDRLMAQTLAFVQGVNQSVNGAQPEVRDSAIEANIPARSVSAAQAAPQDVVVPRTDASSNSVASTETAKTIATIASHQAERNEAIAASATAILSASSAPPLQRVRPAVLPLDPVVTPPTSTAQRQIPLTAGSEREDILKRVAAFRARQSRLSQDRESYYNEMHAKIRERLGNDDSDTALR